MAEEFYPFDRTVHCRLFDGISIAKLDLDDIIDGCIKRAGVIECTRNVYYFPTKDYGQVQGVSSASVLSESHLTFHISPEHNYVQMDLSTCGKKPSPLDVVPFVLSKFKPLRAKIFYEYFGDDPLIFPATVGQFLALKPIEHALRDYDMVAFDDPKSRLRREYGIELEKK